MQKGVKMKKKTLVIILILIIIICILGYIFIKITNPTIRAVVVKANDTSLFVIDVKDKSPYYIGLPTDINLQFKQGEEIMVYCKYNTIIQQTYPGSISNQYIKKIKILKEKSNIRNTK